MKENRDIWLKTVPQMHLGQILSGLGFALYVAAAALGAGLAAEIVGILFGTGALYVLCSISVRRREDPETVSYSMLWGQSAVTLLLLGCAVAGIKARLG